MDSRERVFRCFEHENPDRPPLDGNFRGEVWETLQNYFGVTDADGVRERLQMDLRSVSPGSAREFAARAAPPHPAYAHVHAKRDDGTLEDEWGVRWQIDSTGRYMLPVYNPLQHVDIDDLPIPDVDAPERWNAAKRRADQLRDRYAIVGSMQGVFRPTWELMGMEEFFAALLERPDYTQRVLSRMQEYKLGEVRHLVGDVKVDIVTVQGDIAMQTGMMLNPNLWRKFFKPGLRELIEYSRQFGKAYFMYHSDGNLSAVLPDLIEVGFNAIDPVQPEAMDPAAIKQQFGKSLVLHGTISTQQTLPFGSVEDVRREVRERIATCGLGGGLIPGPSNTLQADVPLPNLFALYETVTEMGK